MFGGFFCLIVQMSQSIIGKNYAHLKQMIICFGTFFRGRNGWGANKSVEGCFYVPIRRFTAWHNVIGSEKVKPRPWNLPSRTWWTCLDVVSVATWCFILATAPGLCTCNVYHLCVCTDQVWGESPVRATERTKIPAEWPFTDGGPHWPRWDQRGKKIK